MKRSMDIVGLEDCNALKYFVADQFKRISISNENTIAAKQLVDKCASNDSFDSADMDISPATSGEFNEPVQCNNLVNDEGSSVENLSESTHENECLPETAKAYELNYGPFLPFRRRRFVNGIDYIVDEIIRNSRRKLFHSNSSMDLISVPATIGPHPLTDYKIAMNRNLKSYENHKEENIKNNTSSSNESSSMSSEKAAAYAQCHAQEFSHSEWFIDDVPEESYS